MDTPKHNPIVGAAVDAAVALGVPLVDADCDPHHVNQLRELSTYIAGWADAMDRNVQRAQARERTAMTPTIDSQVEAAYRKWIDTIEGRIPASSQTAATTLIKAAEAADQPLCAVWGYLCYTPYALTLRSCCDTWVCEGHEDEHDRNCAEFAAQLREERL